MSRPRTGTFEPGLRLGDRHRGRLRLADGTKSARFDLPASMTEREARDDLARLQREEDATHTLYKAKQARVR